jgi:CheY-like chemotaxis protein
VIDRVKDVITWALVVEDSPTQAIHLQELLKNTGIQVFCATNGNMGLRMASQLRPDVIILDIQMPDINGFEVCKILKSSPETAHIPVILFTRDDTPEAIQLGLEYGAVDYIPKDAFADAVLIETLRQMGIIIFEAKSKQNPDDPSDPETQEMNPPHVSP